MAFSQRQLASVETIDHSTVRGVVEALGHLNCEVLVKDQLFRVGSEVFTFKDLTAYLFARATDSDGDTLKSGAWVGYGIVYYQQLVGVTPVTAKGRTQLCEAAPDSRAAMEGARRIASWSVAGAGPMPASDRELRINSGAHVILCWVENVKRHILGIPLEGRQIILDFFGESGAFKTISMLHLLQPLQAAGLLLETSSLAAILDGHEGVNAAMFAAIWLDDTAVLPKKLLPLLKQFVHADTWRANAKGETVQFLPKLASLAVTHNPWPETQYPDSAMSRRLGSIHYPGVMARGAARRYVDNEIFSMDMTAFWRAVDPVNRISDETVVAATQTLFAIKDPIHWFIDECTSRRIGHDTTLNDLFAAFRTRAQSGGWDIAHWTDRSLASWLRAQSYVLARGSQGMKVRGLKLHQAGFYGEEVETEAEAE